MLKRRLAGTSSPGTWLSESGVRLAGLLALFLATVTLAVAEQHGLLLLSGVSLLGTLVFLRHPQWLFILIIALIPYWGLRSFYGINVQWPMGMALLLILLFSNVPNKRLPTELASGLWYPCALLLSIFILSSLQSQFPDTAWRETFLLLSAYMYIGLGFVYIDRSMVTTLLPRTILVTVSIGSTVVLIDYLFDLPFVPVNPRGFGLSNNPNNVAKMAIVTLPLIVHGLVYGRIMRRGLLVALLILNTAVVIVTFVRSGFLVLLITLMMLAYQYRSKLRPMRFGPIIASLTVVFSVAIVAIPQTFWERQLSLLEFRDSSLKRRVAYLYIGWESFLRAPFLGTGPGTFKDVYTFSPRGAEFLSESEQERRYKLRETKTRRYAHNGYLEILVGSGLVGLSVYLAILAMTLRRFSRAIARYTASGDGEMASLITGYRISYIALLLYLLVGSVIFHKYFLLFVALSEVVFRLSRSAR